MYRRPNLSFFLALSLACILAVFVEFEGDLTVDVTPAAAEVRPARGPVQVIPLGVTDANAEPAQELTSALPAPSVGGQTLEH